MSALATALGLALAVAGALLIYLGAPNQRLRARPLPYRPAMAGGAAASVASLIILLQIMGTAASFFVLLVVLMMVWTALPFAALLLRGAKDKRS